MVPNAIGVPVDIGLGKVMFTFSSSRNMLAKELQEIMHGLPSVLIVAHELPWNLPVCVRLTQTCPNWPKLT